MRIIDGAVGLVDPRTTGVVLAAGAGTRLGLGPKALLPFHGRPLVEAIAHTLLDAGCREVVVVLGAGASEVEAAANLGSFRVVTNAGWESGMGSFRVVTNAGWESGMGSSFLLGNQSAHPADHLLIALVDQPGLTRETVERLLARHQPGRITAAAYRRRGSGDAGAATLRRGHPLLIDASLREAVCATVAGDAGARGFLRSRPELVDEVDCSDQSSGEDVDTPDQLGLLH